MSIEQVEQIYERLGKVVLIPLKDKSKQSSIPEWSKLTFEKTQELDYRLKLIRATNIAVLLGKASGGLCVIDVDDDQLATKMLMSDPDLSLTYHTRGKRGVAFWLFMDGDYPHKRICYKNGNGPEPLVEFRTDGGYQVVSGIHPETGEPYIEIGEWENLKPQRRSFDSLKWPKELTQVNSEVEPPPPLVEKEQGSGLQEMFDENIQHLCRKWFPNGRKEGSDWVIASTRGERGNSLHISLVRGKAGVWQDWETSQKGGFLELLVQKKLAKDRHVAFKLVEDECEPEIELQESGDFPAPMNEAAFHGLAGEFVNLVYPETEACKEALLIQFLTWFGSRIGHGPRMDLDGWQHTNLYTAIVGTSGNGAKGTSLNVVETFAQAVDYNWWVDRGHGGYQSGESVVETLALLKESKSVLMIEHELNRLFTVMARQGTTFRDYLELMWDCKAMSTHRVRDNHVCHDPHGSIIGHIQTEVARGSMKASLRDSGLANRFLYCSSRRSKVVVFPKQIQWREHELVDRVKKVIQQFEEKPEELAILMRWSDEGSRAYAEFAESGESDNVFLTRRRPQVARLSMLYALLDGKGEIGAEHIRAARVVWDYNVKTVEYVFGNVINATNNSAADKILFILKRLPAGHGLNLKQISLQVFNNNADKATVHMALEELKFRKLAYMARGASTGGRPPEIWYAYRN
jgi:hypothetical protein